MAVAGDTTERVIALRRAGWAVTAIARELGISVSTVYRRLPPELRRGEIRGRDAANVKTLGDSLRRWHERMRARGLPRNGSVTIEGREVIRTGWREPDRVALERAREMYADGKVAVKEIARRCGISVSTLYKYVRLRYPRDFRNPRLGGYRPGSAATLRRWHEELRRLGLPRDGSVTVRDGRVVETGRKRPARWPWCR